MNESITLADDTGSLHAKMRFLSKGSAYNITGQVELIETHMSLVFLTPKFVYKLKKPVRLDFLDFSTLEARHKYCLEEVRVNQALAGDTYRCVVPINVCNGRLNLGGDGETIDWVVKMKRLPISRMLDAAIRSGTVREDWLQKAAGKLAAFYRESPALAVDPAGFRKALMADIESNCSRLLDEQFKLDHTRIIAIATDLLYFILKQAAFFHERIAHGRIIDAHGDLRPEHICVGEMPLIIDRLEFSRDLRIMDVAEELSFFALECEMLGAPEVGRLFFRVYETTSGDNIPGMLVSFYKAKRAFLRARLSINHLLDEQYLRDSDKWSARCEGYLRLAAGYCTRL